MIGIGLGKEFPIAKSPGIVRSGLTGEYWFDEGTGQTLLDHSGHVNNGTLGSTTGVDTNDPTWTAQGLSFSGVDDYVKANNYMGASTRFSVMLGIYLAANQIQKTMFSNYNDAAYGWVVGISDSVQNVPKFFLGTSTLYGTAVPIQTHLVLTATYDNGSPKLYRNVSLDATSADTINFTGTYGNPQTFGALGAPSQYFNGLITCGLVYKGYCLTPVEIAQNYKVIKERLAKRGVVLP